MHNPSGYMLYDLIKFLNFNIHNIRLAKLSHLVHLNAFSPVWVPSRNFTSWGFICFLQVTWLWEAHLVLLNTFSPLWPFMKLCQLWVLSCFFMSCDPENFLPHLGHKNCFSPVWTSHFSPWSPDPKNIMPHFLHLNCFSPVMMRGPTWEGSHSSAQSVTRAAHYQVTWKHMRRSTQERSHSSAQIVTRAAQHQVTWTPIHSGEIPFKCTKCDKGFST